FEMRSRHDWHAFRQRFGVFAPMGFDNTDNDLSALLQLLLCGLQHRVGLAPPRRHAEENLQLAARSRSFFALQTGENLIRVWSLRLAHAPNLRLRDLSFKNGRLHRW